MLSILVRVSVLPRRSLLTHVLHYTWRCCGDWVVVADDGDDDDDDDSDNCDTTTTTTTTITITITITITATL